MGMSKAAGLALLLLSAPASAPARFHIGAPAADTRECISLHAIRDESAENDETLLFHSGGGRVFRNKLPKPCDDLRSINSLGRLRLQPKGDRDLCRGDMMTVSGSGILGAVGLGASGADEHTCTLGSFEAIGEMSVSEELRR